MAKFTYSVCESCLKANKVSLEKSTAKSPVCGHCGTPLEVQGAIVNLGTKPLQKLIETSPLPVIVDFWASWCAPCRAFAPTFEKVAEEQAGRAVFVKVDTEKNMFASQAFGVRGIPLIAAFSGGKELSRQSGALPYEHFQSFALQVISASGSARAATGSHTGEGTRPDQA